VFSGLGELEIAEDGGRLVLRTRDRFLNRRGDTVLVEAVVREAGRLQSFYLLVSGGEGKLTLRIAPRPDPEKTPGVTRLVREVAARLRALCPELRVLRSNLPEEPGEGDGSRSGSAGGHPGRGRSPANVRR